LQAKKVKRERERKGEIISKFIFGVVIAQNLTLRNYKSLRSTFLVGHDSG